METALPFDPSASLSTLPQFPAPASPSSTPLSTSPSASSSSAPSSPFLPPPDSYSSQPSPSNPPRSFHHRWRGRGKMIVSTLGLLFMLAVVMIGAWQIKEVREFFGQASGEKVVNLMIDTQAVLGPMPRPWRNLAQGGEDHDWRIGPISNQVKNLHPAYIRLDHIYDFYDIVHGSPGNLTFDFSKLDGILDDIQATGAKPYISLSYMPPAIANGDILANPVRWEDWQETVRRTIQHVSAERRTADVYYEVWNEPDLFGNWHYGGKNGKNYLTLYTYAARGEQQARSAAGMTTYKFGGPAITALYKNWFDALLNHCIKNNLRLDFFSWHRYALNIDQYRKDMSEARTWLLGYPQLVDTMELHITEWGHDSNNNPGYDTPFAAAHTVAGAIEMTNVVERAFVFEIQDGKSGDGKEFWGRWGLFTHKDVGAKPKSRYNALRLLDRISDQRLQVLGKGSWVKALAARADDGSVEVVMVNYDQAGANVENVPVTFQHVEPGEYTVTKEYLGGRKQTEKVSATLNPPTSPNQEGGGGPTGEDANKMNVQIHVAMEANSVVFVRLKKER